MADAVEPANPYEGWEGGDGHIRRLTWREGFDRGFGHANARITQLEAELAKLRGQRFPLLDGPSIPWAMIQPWERQAIQNHGQTLEELAARGGLACVEAVCVLEGRRFNQDDRFFTLQAARARIVEFVRDWPQNQLAEARAASRAFRAALDAREHGDVAAWKCAKRVENIFAPVRSEACPQCRGAGEVFRADRDAFERCSTCGGNGWKNGVRP